MADAAPIAAEYVPSLQVKLPAITPPPPPAPSPAYQAGDPPPPPPRTEDEEDQKKIHQLIIDVYESLGFPMVFVPVLPPKERLEFILKYI